MSALVHQPGFLTLLQDLTSGLARRFSLLKMAASSEHAPPEDGPKELDDQPIV